METVFENDVIKVSRTGRDCDFIAVVENKTNKEIKIVFDNELEFCNFSVNSNDWIGLLANDDGHTSLEELVAERFKVV